MVGPLVEIHDATTASGQAALFGFVGLTADQRRASTREQLTDACVAQLALLFGPLAGQPRATLFKDWAQDALTATADDKAASGHPSASTMAWLAPDWADHVSLAGSETSDADPGYLAGAVNAGRRAAERAWSAMSKNRTMGKN